MPSNFRQSCLAPLDSDKRFTASHVLSGTNDVQLGNEMLSARGEGKVSSVFDRSVLDNEGSTNIVLSLRDAKGVPIPEEGVLRESIRSRRCRVCLMRGGRSTVGVNGTTTVSAVSAVSESKEGKEDRGGNRGRDLTGDEPANQTPRGWAREQSNPTGSTGFLGNQHIVPAAWSENYEDVWTFSKKTTKTGNKKFMVRVGNAAFNPSENMFLLIELTCTAKKSKDAPRAEMSCGWCCIPLSDLNTDTAAGGTALVLKKQYPLLGGSMADTTSIKSNEILQRRKGLRTIPKLFIGKSQPSISIFSLSLTKLDRFEQETVHALPPTIITSVASLPLLRCYRALFIKASNNTHVVSAPTLNIFPYILDHPELFELLTVRTKLLKATFIKNSAKAMELFKQEVLHFWPAFCNSQSMDAQHTENHDGKGFFVCLTFV